MSSEPSGFRSFQEFPTFTREAGIQVVRSPYLYFKGVRISMQFRVRNFQWIPRSWVCDSLSFQSKGHNQQCAQRSCLVFARGRTTIKRNARVRVPSIVFLTASLSSKYFKASPNRHCLGNADTTTFNTVAKRRWHQAKHDL